MVESKFDFAIPKTLPSEMMGGSDVLSSKLSLLSPLWASDALMELITVIYSKEVDGRELASKGLMDTSFVVSMLATKLGERPESLGTDSINALLEDLAQDVGKLQGRIKDELDNLAQEMERRE